LVIPYARRALAAQQPALRVTAARALAILAADAESALPHLARALADSDVEVRVAVFEALGEFSERAAGFAPLIAERLTHATTDEERAAAADALQNMEPDRDNDR